MIKMQRLGVREKAKAKLIFNATLISVPPGESNQRSTESATGCCGCFYFCLWVKEERGKLKQGGVGNVRRTVNDSDEPFDNQPLLFTSIMKPLRAETPPEQLSLTPRVMLCAVGAMAIRISQNFDLIFWDHEMVCVITGTQRVQHTPSGWWRWSDLRFNDWSLTAAKSCTVQKKTKLYLTCGRVAGKPARWHLHLTENPGTSASTSDWSVVGVAEKQRQKAAEANKATCLLSHTSSFSPNKLSLSERKR